MHIPIQIADVIREIRGPLIEVDKNETGPGVELDLDEAVPGLIEFLRFFHTVGVREATVVRVSPAVVGAHDAIAIAFSFQQLRPAMPAGVGKRPEHPVVTPNDDKLHPHQLSRHEVAGIWQVIDSTHEIPFFQKDLADLALVELGREIAGRWQGLRLA